MALRARQWVDAFDSALTAAGCSVSLGVHNALTAIIASATNDQAVERYTVAGKLPAGSEGYARFHFTTPAAFALTGNATIFMMDNSGAGSILQLYIGSTLLPSVYSAGGILGAGTNVGSSGAALASSTEYTFEIWWKKNVSIVVKQNGTTIINEAQSGATGNAVVADLRVGIDHYDGASATGWTALVTQLQVGDSQADTFSDPANPVNTAAASIAGSLVQGSTLTVTPGTWTSTAGTPSLAYLWKRDGASLGVTTTTYATVVGDVGHNITCDEIATNTFGSTTTGSNSLGPITAYVSASKDFASIAASAAAGYQEIVLDRGASFLPAAWRFQVVLEKWVVGETHGAPGSRLEATGIGATQALAEAMALTAINYLRAHRYGFGTGVSSGAHGGEEATDFA